MHFCRKALDYYNTLEKERLELESIAIMNKYGLSEKYLWKARRFKIGLLVHSNSHQTPNSGMEGSSKVNWISWIIIKFALGSFVKQNDGENQKIINHIHITKFNHPK